MRIADTERRLENWGRAARSADPLHLARPGERMEWNTIIEAPAAISPVFEFWNPNGCWDESWGDPVPPPPPPPPIDERDADYIDKLLGVTVDGKSKVLAHHRQIIKEWYWKLRKRRITQDDHDGAVRALADILYPLVEMRRAA